VVSSVRCGLIISTAFADGEFVPTIPYFDGLDGQLETFCRAADQLVGMIAVLSALYPANEPRRGSDDALRFEQADDDDKKYSRKRGLRSEESREHPADDDWQFRGASWRYLFCLSYGSGFRSVLLLH